LETKLTLIVIYKYKYKDETVDAWMWSSRILTSDSWAMQQYIRTDYIDVIREDATKSKVIQALLGDYSNDKT